MLSCFFWNQGKNDLTGVVELIGREFCPDILVFCETGTTSEESLEALNRTEAYFFTSGLVDERFHIFTRFPSEYAELRKEHDRFLIFEIAPPIHDRFLLMVLHAPSRRSGWDSDNSAIESGLYADALREVQKDCMETRSVVVGDFNMNPFDFGMIGTQAFHAVMDARIALRGTRTVQQHPYAYFYNPMWNLLGDRTEGPVASYYYNGNTHKELHWHMFDQVIVSHDMIEFFDVDSLRILDRIGDVALTSSLGRPRKKKFSDHLPLYFQLGV